MCPAPVIDAVCMWVDGTRPDYLELVRLYAGTPRDLNPERYRDPFDLLRYSLRSIELHAPWLRNIYLFTCRPQVPAWLRADHPRIRVVHHDETGAPPGMLPTFNSNVIESLFHRLPGMSEQFLYLNDDHFLCADTTPLDFLTRDGRIRIFGTVCGEHFRRRVYHHQIISLGLLEHGPFLIDRGEWAAMLQEEAKEVAACQLHRFRQPDDLRLDRLYRWHMLTHCREGVVVEPCWRYLRYAIFHKIKPGAEHQRRALARIARRRPRFLCLNDDLGPHADDAVVQIVREFLDGLFPHPSSFEQVSPA